MSHDKAGPGEGLRHRLLAYFAKHPGNELTYSEVAKQFGCSRQYAQDVGREMVLAGEIEYVRIIRLPAVKRLLRKAA